MKILRPGLLATLLSLVACASHQPKAPQTQEYFSTLIKADGSKQFSYTLVMDMPEGKRGGRGEHRGPPPGGMGGGMESGMHGPGGHGGGHRGERGPGDESGKENPMAEQLEHLAKEGLLAKLEDSGYCRDSYNQLDKNERRHAIMITGECVEDATDEDRKNFPNPVANKVVEERLD